MERPWFEMIFDERYPQLFGPVEGNAEREVAEIVSFLSPPAGAAVEDLGCGRGRHAIPFARRGYRVTGVDLSDGMLRIARESACREGVPVEWVREDMRTFCRPGAFDLCLSLFTSFGFFSDHENQRVLENVAACLKEGGILLLDLRNAGKGLARIAESDRIMDVPSGRLRISVRYDQGSRRARAQHVLTRPDGIIISSAFDVRIYSPEELQAGIGRAGMRMRGYYGSLAGCPFDDDSERMVVVARKE